MDPHRQSAFRRELERAARNVRDLAKNIELAADGSSPTAMDFARLVGSTAGLVQQKLAAGRVPARQFALVDALLQFLGEHLRYAEHSRISQTPWSLVQATEAFLQRHTSDRHNYLIRPQWAYNYSILPDLVGHYRALVAALEQGSRPASWITVAEWLAVLRGIGEQRIYCISFPRIERLNVLFHIQWGHEAGHIFAQEWAETRFPALWAAEVPGVRRGIEAELNVDLGEGEDPDLRTALGLGYQAALALQHNQELAEFGIGELISDAVGIHLFGPALLAAVHEFSCRYDLDASPVENHRYPPWRYRLRMMARQCQDQIDAGIGNRRHAGLLEPYLDALRRAVAVTEVDSDQAVLRARVESRYAYDWIARHWDSIWAPIEAELERRGARPFVLGDRAEAVGELVARLDEGIPPNELGSWPDNRPAELPDIWNAAWAFTYHATDRNPAWGTPADYDELFRLTLKGIESSFVHRTFGSKDEHDQ